MSNHQPCSHVDLLRFAFLFTAFLLVPVTESMGQYGASSTSMGQYAGGLQQAGGGGGGGGPSAPFGITAGVQMGYNDNVRLGGAGGGGSLSINENLTLSYDRYSEGTELNMLAVGRFAQYVDVGTDDKDGNLTLSLTRNISTRLSVIANVYAAYQTEPDFISNVGLENVRADHFYTTDILSVNYQWLPRLNTVTSYNFGLVKYVQSSAETSQQDRTQHTFGEQLQFSLTSRTRIVGVYRFQIVDYDTAPRDSTTHYLLAGVNHNLTEHLVINVLGGESYRSFKNDGDSVNPHFEGSLAYASSNHSLNWTTSYSVEEPSLQQALTRTTLRTGLRLTYDLTSRISSTAGVFYHHDENEAASPSGTSPIGSQDTFNLTLGLRYTINRHFAIQVDYQHSSQSSEGTASGYSRNRYSAGLTYTY
jgi:hypothetical protein